MNTNYSQQCNRISESLFASFLFSVFKILTIFQNARFRWKSAAFVMLQMKTKCNLHTIFKQNTASSDHFVLICVPEPYAFAIHELALNSILIKTRIVHVKSFNTIEFNSMKVSCVLNAHSGTDGMDFAKTLQSSAEPFRGRYHESNRHTFCSTNKSIRASNRERRVRDERRANAICKISSRIVFTTR